MPIYEYSCEKCNEMFEKFVKVSDGDDKVQCPKCGNSKVKRLFSLFGIGGAGERGTNAPARNGDKPCGQAYGGG